ncbi:hypothetical protein BISA_0581 [Bifidobacterium saguini DSM 23967]|uniref:Uncharacterized protein n=1 Tax=Bifidobacterium saguini DSM 23967 TaxID=1437607 RepID=A0A087D9I5_9BIFI|nr:hypothetical protein BISA_0581 [Bifidobacterium saguini DSM 23967]
MHVHGSHFLSFITPVHDGGGNPDLTHRELRKCLIWCTYHVKNLWEYKTLALLPDS